MSENAAAENAKVDEEKRVIPEEGQYPDAEKYLRLQIGNKLNHKRYVVQRKLGYGLHSTVWLAWDTKSKTYVAIKAIMLGDDADEIKILQEIQSHATSSKHPGKLHVAQLLRAFKHTTPDGEYNCYVTPVMGCCLRTQARMYERERIPVAAMKEISRQLLQGLDFLHRECNVIHADLKPSDILLELEHRKGDIEAYLADIPAYIVETSPRILKSMEELKAKLVAEDPEMADKEITFLGSNDSMLETQVLGTEKIPRPLPKVSEMERFRVRIVDFGAARTAEHSYCYEQTVPPLLRPPEIVVGGPFNTPADIFTLGCIIWESVKGHFPFTPNDTHAPQIGDWTIEKERSRLIRLIETMGPFPKPLLDMTSSSDNPYKKLYFADNGKLKDVDFDVVPGKTPLISLLDGEGELKRPDGMSEEEVTVFADFLWRMLRLDPKERWTAEELLRHEWLK